MTVILPRKRGGQPGNQNARKHGFYSHTLSPSEVCELIAVTNQESVDRETAVLRIKMKSVLRSAPGNKRVIKEALKVMARLAIAKANLDYAAAAEFKKLVRDFFRGQRRSFCNNSPPLPGVLQNDIPS